MNMLSHVDILVGSDSTSSLQEYRNEYTICFSVYNLRETNATRQWIPRETRLLDLRRIHRPYEVPIFVPDISISRLSP